MKLKRILTVLLTALCLNFVYGQETNGYQLPPKNVQDLILAPSTPLFSLCPMKDRYLIAEIDDLPTIEEQAQEELRLAGTRILSSTNAPKFRTKIKKLTIEPLPNHKVKGGVVDGFPQDVRILDFKWSPDGTKIAACVETKVGVNLWVVDVNTLQAKLLSTRMMNLFFGTKMYEWTPNSEKLLVAFVPENRNKEFHSQNLSIVPVIQENDGKKNPLRTYQDLLSDESTEKEFDYYATSQLSLVDATSGEITNVAPPAVYSSASISPDGKYFFTEHISKPYSYVVPYRYFPVEVEIRTISGEFVNQVYKRELVEYEFAGKGSAFPGLRSFSWRADMPSTLSWIDPLDGGDADAKVAYRDRVMEINQPFSGEAKELVRTDMRIMDVLWGDSKNAFVLMRDHDTRYKKCIYFNPQNSAEQFEIYNHSSQDLYQDAGTIMLHKNSFNKDVVLSHNNYKTIYFTGRGYSPDGALPFIDELQLQKNKKTRLWQSQNPYYEYPVDFVDLLKGLVITSRESNYETPNYFLRNIKRNTLTALTAFENPYPSMDGVTKEVVEYVREDGVNLSGDLYLPAGYKKGDKALPLLLWAYPSEFKSSDNAGQRRDAPNQFIRYTRTSPILWVAQGYAVLNNAAFPIIGEGDKEPNDTYVEQLVNNAKAAIDKMVEIGVADRSKIAVGGHSYGAFMTANLLANSDLFAAGIARSGAYNRTLTPFGFQNEKRTFWEASDVYLEMSPFVSANKLKTPILLIHGQADNNTGTFTMQSERLYAALKGNGGVTRLVLLPFESHGYVAKESVLHQAWETWRWLEKYVK